VSEAPAARLQTLRESGGFFPIRHRSRIRLTGADHLRYLNGQLTADVVKLAAGTAKPALLLTSKGKLCAPVWVWKDGDSLIVEVGDSLREETVGRLERYIISDDVALGDMPPASQVFHVFGTGASPAGCLKIERLGVPGFDTNSEPENLLMAEPAEVEFLRIERAIPAWGPELDCNTLPQEARLETSFVDFDKGCYVGQEVVSRLRSVGRVNRLLHAFQGTLEPTPAGRLSLHLPDRPGDVAGTLTSWCHDFELAQTIALGYLNREFDDSESFVAADAAGNALGKLIKRPILT
jgi:folate-binding protein YgfZ